VLAYDEARDSTYWNEIDTVRINEVSIVSSRLSHLSSTEKKEEIEAFQLQAYLNNDISYLLNKTSLVNIVSYGASGSMSTIGIRGGGSNHTAVLWNGIPINSLTTGGADLSMLSVGAFDQINVIYGASGSIYGSGTFGGAIELNNLHDFRTKKDISLYSEISSFSNRKIRATAKCAGSRFSYSGQVFYHDGKNDFKFVDKHEIGSPTNTMRNAENKELGFVQNVGIKLNKHQLNFGLWYQVKDHNIPGKMGAGPPVSYQEQKDSTLKAFAAWKYMVGKVRFDYQTAWISDFLRYKDREPMDNSWKVFSEIGSKRWLNTFSTRYYCIDQLSFDAQLKFNTLKGVVTAYNEDKKEQEAIASLAAQYRLDRLIVNASANKEWNSVKRIPLVYSLGATVFIMPEVLKLRAKFGSHYRRPTFNERYWPGGDPDLDSEKGYGFETGFVYQQAMGKYQLLSFDLTAYRYINKQMIIWMPVDGLSKPVNTNDVLTKGLEVGVNWKWKSEKSTANIIGKYALNKTIYNKKGLDNYKQTLAYKPEHIAKIILMYGRKRWSVNVNNSYQSQMMSVERKLMEDVFLSDIMGTYQIRIKKPGIVVSGKVQNVLGESYQLQYAYPMPGRIYSLGINIKL